MIGVGAVVLLKSMCLGSPTLRVVWQAMLGFSCEACFGLRQHLWERSRDASGSCLARLASVALCFCRAGARNGLHMRRGVKIAWCNCALAHVGCHAALHRRGSV
mmetsp:Transcript_36717/g.88228  ORF Transcript_36717/g.88228 Transcript_36717/m.88228 type:complete len:104 (+) Transcript_36717:1215-1526(+)